MDELCRLQPEDESSLSGGSTEQSRLTPAPARHKHLKPCRFFVVITTTIIAFVIQIYTIFRGDP